MVLFNIQNDAHCGMEGQIAVGIFAGFCEEGVGMSHPDVAADLRKDAPTVMVGSMPASRRSMESMEVVVVFPCVPATAMAVR